MHSPTVDVWLQISRVPSTNLHFEQYKIKTTVVRSSLEIQNAITRTCSYLLTLVRCESTRLYHLLLMDQVQCNQLCVCHKPSQRWNIWLGQHVHQLFFVLFHDAIHHHHHWRWHKTAGWTTTQLFYEMLQMQSLAVGWIEERHDWCWVLLWVCSFWVLVDRRNDVWWLCVFECLLGSKIYLMI